VRLQPLGHLSGESWDPYFPEGYLLADWARAPSTTAWFHSMGDSGASANRLLARNVEKFTERCCEEI
jgi:hypothetical protein